MAILVTGGAGYLGAHACVALMEAGREVVVLDNFDNSQPGMLDRVARIAGARPRLIEGDVRDTALAASVLRHHAVDAVIHFAGLKAVGESTLDPVRYYDCNVGGTISICRAMQETGVRTLIYSSSATVYGAPEQLPVREDSPCRPESPYARSKLMSEHMLADLCRADPGWRVACLRYFNPVGAHGSGLIGEAPNGTPNNLMPFIAQVAAGQRGSLRIFGRDYATRDGTGVRDYIHVVDLVAGHLAALDHLRDRPGLLTLNLGTGRGCSVLEMVAAFERACGFPIPHEFVARRPGDVAQYWADPGRAQSLLGWRARRDIDAMCRHAWRWQRHHAGLEVGCRLPAT